MKRVYSTHSVLNVVSIIYNSTHKTIYIYYTPTTTNNIHGIYILVMVIDLITHNFELKYNFKYYINNKVNI